MQLSDVVIGLTGIFLLDYGMQLLKTLNVIFCIVFEDQKLDFLNVKNAVSFT